MKSADELLIDRIRGGDEDAWRDLIARYEGRLLAFVEGRVRDRASAEDIVQETFLGFLTSLPNYDRRRALESYLFSIAAHKLTDHLRRIGRRPALPLAGLSGDSESWDVPGPQRGPSTLLRSGERRGLEAAALEAALREQIDRWRERGEWPRLMCLELLVVRGLANKDAAQQLGIAEQLVANWKFEFIARLRTLLKRQDLPQDVFPELQEP